MAWSKTDIGIVVYCSFVAGRFIALLVMPQQFVIAIVMLIGANVGMVVAAWGHVSSSKKDKKDWIEMLFALIMMEIVIIIPTAIESLIT